MTIILFDLRVLQEYNPSMKINDSQIAKKAGVSKQTLSNIINGRRRPSWRAAKRIAYVTSTDPVLWMEGAPYEIKKAVDLFKCIISKPYLQ